MSSGSSLVEIKVREVAAGGSVEDAAAAIMHFDQEEALRLARQLDADELADRGKPRAQLRSPKPPSE